MTGGVGAGPFFTYRLITAQFSLSAIRFNTVLFNIGQIHLGAINNRLTTGVILLGLHVTYLQSTEVTAVGYFTV